MELFGHLVHFACGVWDRIVLRGFCGIPCITPKVLAKRTTDYRKQVEAYAKRHHIEILSAPKGVRKEEFVAPHYRGKKSGVVVILKSMEQDDNAIISCADPARPWTSLRESRLNAFPQGVRKTCESCLHRLCRTLDRARCNNGRFE